MCLEIGRLALTFCLVHTYSFLHTHTLIHTSVLHHRRLLHHRWTLLLLFYKPFIVCCCCCFKQVKVCVFFSLHTFAVSPTSFPSWRIKLKHGGGYERISGHFYARCFDALIYACASLHHFATVFIFHVKGEEKGGEKEVDPRSVAGSRGSFVYSSSSSSSCERMDARRFCSTRITPSFMWVFCSGVEEEYQNFAFWFEAQAAECR